MVCLLAHQLCWRASTLEQKSISACDWLVLLLVVFPQVCCFLTIATVFQVMRPRPTASPTGAEKKHGTEDGFHEAISRVGGSTEKPRI